MSFLQGAELFGGNLANGFISQVSKALLLSGAQKLAKRPSDAIECFILASPLLHLARHNGANDGTLVSCLRIAHQLRAQLVLHRVATVVFRLFRAGGRFRKRADDKQKAQRDEGCPITAVAPHNCWTAVLQLPPGLPPAHLSTASSVTQLAEHFRVELAALAASLLAEGAHLPTDVFHPDGLELMRFAVASGILQAATPHAKVAVLQAVAMHVKEVLAWRETNPFMAQQQQQAWSHIAWWHGSDAQGRPVLWSHAGRAVLEGSSGAELCSAALTAQMEWGLRNLSPYTSPSTSPSAPRSPPAAVDQITCVILCQGVGLLRARKLLPLFKSTARAMTVRYPGRLHTLYLVGLPPWAQLIFRAVLAFMHPDTRRKLRTAPLSSLDSTLTLQLPACTLLSASASGFCIGPDLHGPAPANRARLLRGALTPHPTQRRGQGVRNGPEAFAASLGSCSVSDVGTDDDGEVACGGWGDGVGMQRASGSCSSSSGSSVRSLCVSRSLGSCSSLSSCASLSSCSSASSNRSLSSCPSLGSCSSLSSISSCTSASSCRSSNSSLCSSVGGGGGGNRGMGRRGRGGEGLQSMIVDSDGSVSGEPRVAEEVDQWEGLASHVALAALLLALFVVCVVRSLVSCAVSVPQLQRRVRKVVEALVAPP